MSEEEKEERVKHLGGRRFRMTLEHFQSFQNKCLWLVNIKLVAHRALEIQCKMLRKEVGVAAQKPKGGRPKKTSFTEGREGLIRGLGSRRRER